MIEKVFQDKVLAVIRALHLMAYHTYDSKRSVSGFPDLVVVGERGVLYRELKTDKGRTSAYQVQWLAALTAAGEDAKVWRPADFESIIVPELRALGRVRVAEPVLSQAQIRRRLR